MHYKDHFQIFDRWGALLFTGKEWDGRYNGEMVNSGVYVYIARVWLEDGIERRDLSIIDGSLVYYERAETDYHEIVRNRGLESCSETCGP